MVRSDITHPLLLVHIVTYKFKFNAISNPLLQRDFVKAADLIDSLEGGSVTDGCIQVI